MFGYTRTYIVSAIKQLCYKTQVLVSQNAIKFLSSDNSPSIIANYDWQIAALTGCHHELSGCLVLGTPQLSSLWTATSI